MLRIIPIHRLLATTELMPSNGGLNLQLFSKNRTLLEGHSSNSSTVKSLLISWLVELIFKRFTNPINIRVGYHGSHGANARHRIQVRRLITRNRHLLREWA